MEQKKFSFTFPFFSFFLLFFIQYVWDAISIIDDYSIQSFLLFSFFLLIRHFLSIPLRYGMPYYAFYVVQGCTTIERKRLPDSSITSMYVVAQYNEWQRQQCPSEEMIDKFRISCFRIKEYCIKIKTTKNNI